MIPKLRILATTTLALGLLAACSVGAAPPSSAPPSKAPASPKPSASAPAPRPTPTTLPAVAADTTKDQVIKTDIPPLAGRPLVADILDIDQQTHLLYMADRTLNGVDVFDVSTPTAKYLKTIDTRSPTNGLIIAKDVNKVFTGLTNSHVAVIDINPASPTHDSVIADINTGGKNRADEVDYDPIDKKIYIVNSDDQFVTVIDAASNQIIKKISVPGGLLEQPRYNAGDGMMYLAGFQDNVIYQFDPKKDVLANKFKIVDECLPSGLAINPNTNQAILGCNNRKQQHTALWDFKENKVVATFDKVGGGDAAIYNGKADRYFFAAFSFYRGSAMGIFGGSPVKFLTNVPTTTSSHAVAYDETNKMVYTEGPNGLLSFHYQ